MYDYRARQNKNRPLEERFWAKVDKKGEDECWEWKAGKYKFGYGEFSYNGKPESSHRISYILTHGSIPEGLFVLHRCNNPLCVNPRHLYIGTQFDNMKQKVNDGRCVCGHSSYWMILNSKLNWEIVNKIREEYTNDKNVTIRELSYRYNVPFGTVGGIVSNSRWKDDNYKQVHRSGKIKEWLLHKNLNKNK